MPTVKPGVYSMEDAIRLGLITPELPAAKSGTNPIHLALPDPARAPSAKEAAKPIAGTRRGRRTNPGSWTELRQLAEMFNDAQEVRVAFENRIGMSADGKERKNIATVDAYVFEPLLQRYKEAETLLAREMTECYRVTVPDQVRKWQESTAGIGDHTLARLLGITGDPRMAHPKHWEVTLNPAEGEPKRILVEGAPHARSIGQLWQYCGHGAPKRKPVKDSPEAQAVLMSNGSPDAKKLVYLMAAAQVKTNAKNGSGYRDVYDAVKDKYLDRTHTSDCAGGFFNNMYVKCKTGPDKAYAVAGDPFQKSHVHAIALRITGKEILRDLWLAAE